MSKQWLKFSITFLFFGSYLLYLAVNFEDLKYLLTINMSVIVQVMLANIATMLLTGYIFYFMVNSLGLKMLLLEWVGLTFVGFIANYITPFKIGTISKSVYLKKKYNFSYTNFLVIFSGYNLLHLIIVSVFGVILGFFIEYFQQGQKTIFVFSLLLFLILILLTVILEYITQHKKVIPQRLRHFFEGWKKLRKSRNVICKLVLCDIIIILLGTITHLLLYRSIKVQTSFSDMLILTVLMSLSSVINITPGNIGVGEWLFVFVSQAFGIGINESIVATGIGRIVHLVLIFGIAPIFYCILFRPFDHKTNLKTDFRNSIIPIDSENPKGSPWKEG